MMAERKRTTKKQTEKISADTAAVKKPSRRKKALPPTDQDFAIEAARLARELHCTDIALLDLRGLNPAADFFLIATGTSDRQSRTVADKMLELAKQKYHLSCLGIAGYEKGMWILLDFITVVVHIFDRQYREYYNLEMLWGDAKRIEY